MFFVTLYDHLYWIVGSTVGAVFGTLINFNTEGIEFVMTSMFVVIFLGQWEKDKNHFSSLSGLLLSAICLMIFGKDNFIIPSMIAILIALALSKGYLERKDGTAK
jgi:4-azaleucine resistance transporter AzlC